MRLTVEDCCQSLGFEPGKETEASLKQELEGFISDDNQTQLRDASINQRSEQHKQAVQEFLDQHGSRFWSEVDETCSDLLDNAPIFPRDIKLISRMVSNLLAYKLRKHKPKDKPETQSDPRMNSESNERTPGQASVTDSEEEHQGMIDDNIKDELEGAATPGYNPETRSQNGVINVVESIETDDPGLRPEAGAPQSPPFGTPSHQNTIYCSPPTRTRAGGDFGPSQLTPQMAAKTLLWVKTSKCRYAKGADLRSCMTPVQFVDTIMGLWDIRGDLNVLGTVTYKMEGAPWPVLMSENIVRGHEIMMGEIGAWWDRSGEGDDRCMVAISITL